LRRRFSCPGLIGPIDGEVSQSHYFFDFATLLEIISYKKINLYVYKTIYKSMNWLFK
jgi:hypothetical protein